MMRDKRTAGQPGTGGMLATRTGIHGETVTGTVGDIMVNCTFTLFIHVGKLIQFNMVLCSHEAHDSLDVFIGTLVKLEQRYRIARDMPKTTCSCEFFILTVSHY